MLEREIESVRILIEAVDDDPILLGHSYGALTAIETATDAYEPAVPPDDFQAEADLAGPMDELIEADDRCEAVKRYTEQVLHPTELMTSMLV